MQKQKSVRISAHACNFLAEEVGFEIFARQRFHDLRLSPSALNSPLGCLHLIGSNPTKVKVQKQKSVRISAHACNFLAEEVGFEPTVPLGTTVFKTAAFVRSAIPPFLARTRIPYLQAIR